LAATLVAGWSEIGVPFTSTASGTMTAFESVTWNAGTAGTKNAFGVSTVSTMPADPQSSTRMRPLSGSADAAGANSMEPAQSAAARGVERRMVRHSQRWSSRSTALDNLNV